MLHSLTGVRALAAVAVFVAHVRWTLPAGAGLTVGGLRIDLDEVLEWGGSGVSLFFVLSGFVLTWTWTDRTSTRAFLLRRLGRIWPAHAVAALAFLGLELAGAASRSPIAAIVAVFLLVQSWVPGSGWANAVNPAAWTLSCEAFFYAVFPWLIGPIRKVGLRHLTAVVAAWWIAAIVVQVAVLHPRGVAVATFPPLRLGEFVMGMAVARAVSLGRTGPLPRAGASLAAIAGYLLVSTQVEALATATEAVLPLGFALLIGRLAVDELATGRPAVIVGHAAVRRAGELSYCFYLVHLLPLVLIGWWRDGDPRMAWGQALGVAALWFVGAGGAAVLLRRYVEVPGAARARAFSTAARP